MAWISLDKIQLNKDQMMMKNKVLVVGGISELSLV